MLTKYRVDIHIYYNNIRVEVENQQKKYRQFYNCIDLELLSIINTDYQID